MDRTVPAKTKGKEHRRLSNVIVFSLYISQWYRAVCSLLHVGMMCISDEKPDLRSNPPVKVKLPSLVRPTPPPVKDKPGKIASQKRWATTHLSYDT